MTETYALKSCPFCDSDEMTHIREVSAEPRHYFYIGCSACDIRTGDYYDPKHCVYAWNQRPDSVAKLRKDRTELLDIATKLVNWCDENRPAGESLYFVSLARNAVTRITRQEKEA